MLLDDFITSQGTNCILGSAFNALRYLGIDIREEDLFFWFCSFEGDKEGSDLLKKMYRAKEECDWKSFLMRNINLHQPVLAKVNPKILPYLRASVDDQYACHYINILGIDEETEQIYVSDSYIPTYAPSTYEGWINYKNIDDADIKSCWCLREEIIRFFKDNCPLIAMREMTRLCIIRRLSAFLCSNIDRNENCFGVLSETILYSVNNKNYTEIYWLLAGLQLNIINPLKYLDVTLLQMSNDDRWHLKINSFLKEYWGSLYFKLMKFALAHKKVDAKLMLEQITEAGQREIYLLIEILIDMLADTNLFNSASISAKLIDALNESMGRVDD